jgi:hypothetical protein
MPTTTTQRPETGAARRRSTPRAGNSRRADTNTTADDRRFLERHGEQLSPSTHRAKWIHSTGETADRRGQTLATRSPEVIRAWAEARGGRPATATRGEDGRPRTLRMQFDGGGDPEARRRGRRLEKIDWDEWLRVFEDRDLVFLYQEQRRDGRQSNFFRLDSPDREDG